jgi:hypothetical protein
MEDIKKLADTLIRTGLASSEKEALEKARATLEAESIIKRAGAGREKVTVSELLNEEKPKKGVVHDYFDDEESESGFLDDEEE